MDRTMVAISFENRTMIMRTKKNYFVSRNLIDKREREREREKENFLLFWTRYIYYCSCLLE